jgi:hypothetical protein
MSVMKTIISMMKEFAAELIIALLGVNIIDVKNAKAGTIYLVMVIAALQIKTVIMVTKI